MTKKNEEMMEEVVVEKAAEAEEKKPVKKTAAKKTTEKKTTKKAEAADAEAAAAEEKKPVKKTTARKKAVKAVVNVQFSGKEYSTEKLIEIAKDVWQYDLGRDAADFKSVELYVKPEEASVYYVINEEVSGSFAI